MNETAHHNILITGAAGYVGTLLTGQLLAAGHNVKAYDIMYFGRDKLPAHERLEVIEADIRDTKTFSEACAGVDAVIHLACISNDPSFELDGGLSKSINYDCFEPMVVVAKSVGVSRFVYASTSSVYGVSDAPDVTEDHPLIPLTDYNKYKGLCEPLLLKHLDDSFVGVIIRPATVCGWSPRLRLDLSVNILTTHAFVNRKITVFGGDQLRPNVHVRDICDLYEMLLDLPADKIQGKAFNAGYQNLSIMDIAKMVKSIVEEECPDKASIEIVRTETNDPRSYHINSDKIAREIGFKPKRELADAVRELCVAFREGRIPNAMEDDNYYNVRTMKVTDAQ